MQSVPLRICVSFGESIDSPAECRIPRFGLDRVHQTIRHILTLRPVRYEFMASNYLWKGQ